MATVNAPAKTMKAVRIHKFGGPEVIVIDELPIPSPGPGELVVRVAAAGVGPWDALVREGKSKVSPPPPLTLGSDLSGAVEAVGAGVAEFKVGDQVYGVTNPQFCGANAEYAVASVAMIARKPERISHIEAASAPVVAVTAWQMLFDYAKVTTGQRILILGAAGNVGAYVVQLGARAKLHVVATAGSKDTEYVRSLGAETIVDIEAGKFDDSVSPVDAVIDTVGGETRDRSFHILKHGGILVSSVSGDPLPERSDVRTVFFYVDVTTATLDKIRELVDGGELVTHVGTVLPLEKARTAHEMLAGAPHKRGKIMLSVSDGLSTS
jgi:NADPH:quinone reductase-like Zn-dependent oxidoreductase